MYFDQHMPHTSLRGYQYRHPVPRLNEINAAFRSSKALQTKHSRLWYLPIIKFLYNENMAVMFFNSFQLLCSMDGFPRRRISQVTSVSTPRAKFPMQLFGSAGKGTLIHISPITEHQAWFAHTDRENKPRWL